MSDEQILTLMRKGKESMGNNDFLSAKTHFTDAAEIALEMSKKLNSDEYRQYARTIISMAKEAKERHDLQQLEDQVDKEDSLEPSNSPTILQKAPKNEANSQSSYSRSGQSKVVPSELENYEMPPKSDIQIKLGPVGEEIITWDPGKLMNGIMMVTGGSGSGKTEWLRSAIIELTSRGYPVIVFDLHGDIDVNIPTFSVDYQGKYGVNPLELLSTDPSDGGPMPNINRVVKLFEDAVSDNFSATMLSYLRSILKIAYNSCGIYQKDPKTWTKTPPTLMLMRDIILNPEGVLSPLSHLHLVQEILATGVSTIAAVKNRVISILEHPAFQSETIIPIEALLQKPARFILKSLQTVDMQFIVADTILRHLFAKTQSIGHIESSQTFDKFRAFIVIDEVKILSGNRGDTSDNYHILNRLATEARKYGLGLILASQVIRHFGRDIRSNAASKLVLRPMDVDEAKKSAKEMEISHEDLMDINLAGIGYYRTTRDDKATRLRLFPVDERPL